MVRTSRANTRKMGNVSSSRNPLTGMVRKLRTNPKFLMVRCRIAGIFHRPDDAAGGTIGSDGVGGRAAVGRLAQSGKCRRGLETAPQEEPETRRGLPGWILVRPDDVGERVAGAGDGAEDEGD